MTDSIKVKFNIMIKINKYKVVRVLVILTFMLLLAIPFSCKTSEVKKSSKVEEVNYIPYYLKVYEADSLNILGEHKRSYKILDSLFKKFEPLNQESYSEYITFLKSKIVLNDFKNIDIVLKRAIQDFGLKADYCMKDSLLNIAVKKSNFNEEDLNGFYDTYVKSLNLEYRYAIEKMIENDQKVRLSVPRNKEEWEKIDKENAETIKLLIAEYGYPSIKKIGRYDFNNKSSNAKTLFLHASKDARENYILNLMLESVKKGECEPSDFASVYDKYLMTTGKYGDKVLYGELRNPKKSIDMLVVNPKKIDSIRKSIGLENIEYRRWKIKKITGIDINDK